MWDDSTRWQHKCRNCGADATTSFCGACGQKVDVHRLSLAALLHEIPHAIFHVDRGFFPTIVGLFSRPGDVVSEYLNGKRAKYFNPLTLLVICGSLCTAFWIVFPFKPDLFWGSVVPPENQKFAAAVSVWFRLVGFAQVLWLPLMGLWLYVTRRTARMYRIQQQMIQEKLASRDAQFVTDMESMEAGSQRTRVLARHHLHQLWTRSTGLVTTSRAARGAIAAEPPPYVYGEFIVMAAFMTCASLVITAAASPLLYLADSSLAYKIGLATAAAAAGVPVYQLLMSSSLNARPSFAAAIMASAYFVIGTPFGFLTAIWVMSFNG